MQKTIKQILEEGGNFELSDKKYNAEVCNPDIIKKDGGACLYRVYKIDEKTNTAFCINTNAWGRDVNYKVNTSDLTPYPN
jgi:hypothetical protein